MGYSRKKQTGAWGYGIPAGIEEIGRGISRGEQESGISRGVGFRS